MAEEESSREVEVGADSTMAFAAVEALGKPLALSAARAGGDSAAAVHWQWPLACAGCPAALDRGAATPAGEGERGAHGSFPASPAPLSPLCAERFGSSAKVEIDARVEGREEEEEGRGEAAACARLLAAVSPPQPLLSPGRCGGKWDSSCGSSPSDSESTRSITSGMDGEEEEEEVDGVDDDHERREEEEDDEDEAEEGGRREGGEHERREAGGVREGLWGDTPCTGGAPVAGGGGGRRGEGNTEGGPLERRVADGCRGGGSGEGTDDDWEKDSRGVRGRQGGGRRGTSGSGAGGWAG